MKFDAQVLSVDADSSTSIYSPWTPRGGDNARFTLELVEASAHAMNITLKVYHKALGDTGDGSVVGSTITLTSPGRTTTEYTGLNELVRFRYGLAGDGTTGATCSATLRSLPALWFDSVKV